MPIPLPPYSSADIIRGYFGGNKNLTRGGSLPSLAQFLRDIFDRLVTAELATSGTSLPGNNEGYGTGFIFTLTGGAVRDPAQFENIGTDAAVNWRLITVYWQQASNPNLVATLGYAGDRVRDTAGGTNYQQRTAPSGNTWDAI